MTLASHFLLLLLLTFSSTSATTCTTVHRPNLYIGTKTCSPLPLSTGLMWYANGDINKIRHTAEMNDGLKNWGWKASNGADFGRHKLLDPKAQIHLISEYTQDSESTSWTMRVTGNLTKKGMKSSGTKDRNDIALIFYVTNADPKGVVKLETQTTDNGPHATISGQTTKEGAFTFQVLRTKSAIPNSKKQIRTHRLEEKENKKELQNIATEVHYAQLRRNPKNLWKTLDLLTPIWTKSQSIASNAVVEEWQKKGLDPREERTKKTAPILVPLLLNTTDKQANMVALQFVVAAPFELVIRYEEKKSNGNLINEDDDNDDINNPTDPIDQQNLAFLKTYRETTATATTKFEKKFESVFGLTSKGFDEKHIAFAQAAFSNLIGSTTYFYGSSIVKPTQPNQQPSKTKPGPLITGVPSRSFFPRGFLWDEGFHQLLVSTWDVSLSRTVVTHWLSRMDKNGWIPREQILGAEATSKVPEKFRLQSPDIANPPALLLTIENMLYPLEHPEDNKDKETATEVLEDGTVRSTGSTGSTTRNQNTLDFLKQIYPKFALHYEWLKKTQSGDKKNTFRWRGQTSTHCLASGLDDYPRAKYFTTGERHVDLLSWMTYAADVLSRVSKVLGRTKDSSKYIAQRQKYQISLEDHWNEKDGIWYDIGVDSAEHVDPQTGRIVRFSPPGQVKHIGYVGLFPFLLKLIDVKDGTNSKNTKRLLKIIHNLMEPHLLWSKYGLRSLSRIDINFGKEEDYWRGKIWLNINYLALRSLKHYSIHAESKEVKELASKVGENLRKNLIQNLYKQYRRSGFIWENYSPQNGRGKGCFPFSGWSSLIVSILAELY